MRTKANVLAESKSIHGIGEVVVGSCSFRSAPLLPSLNLRVYSESAVTTVKSSLRKGCSSSLVVRPCPSLTRGRLRLADTDTASVAHLRRRRQLALENSLGRCCRLSDYSKQVVRTSSGTGAGRVVGLAAGEARTSISSGEETQCSSTA